MPEDWSREEVEAAVADYFVMLGNQLRGEPYNKAEHNRQLLKLLSAERRRGSIERKHQNISAVLIELGYPYVYGYKPLRNYQTLLAEVVVGRLAGEHRLEELVASKVHEPVANAPFVKDILSTLVAPPRRENPKPVLSERAAPRIVRAGRNYLEIEARNRSLGRAGEEFIMRFEHERLWRAGKRDLADRIQHVAESEGDYLGYDIRSFETDGRDRLVEVKTTRFGPMTPFFASRNEVRTSEERQREYHLYRLFDFSQRPRLFTLAGPLDSSFHLEPFTYSAEPK